MLKPAELWNDSVRFIEVGADNGIVGVALRETGLRRYLAVTDDEKTVQRLRAMHPELADSVVFSDDPRVVQRNNADVLILSGKVSAFLWKYGTLRQVRHVVWEPSLSWPGLRASAGCILNTLAGRLRWPRLVKFQMSAGARRILIFSANARYKAKLRTRCYIPHALSIAGFFKSLGDRDICYVILRWFERLPEIDPGEDIDILVRDDHLQKVRELLAAGPGIQPLDLYSVSGVKGSDYRSMAYYPPYIAEQILAEAVCYRGFYRVPSPEHHFLSLAYHAVYHKGEISSLRTVQEGVSTETNPEHDYGSILSGLADRLGIKVICDLDYLDAFLKARGWRPPKDTMHRFASRSQWAAAVVRGEMESAKGEGLAVFVVRERGVELGLAESIQAAIEGIGFTVLVTKTLSAEEAKNTARFTRGGNWDLALGKMRGGLPAFIIVCYDPFPLPVSPQETRRYPGLSNGRILKKQKIRDKVTDGKCNVLHSTDNADEAWYYVRIFMPERYDEIATAVQDLEAWAAPGPDVLRSLTQKGRRAKVDLIKYDGGVAVRKTFKPGYERFLQRELFAMQELSHFCSRIPRLLDSDERSIVYPYIEDIRCYRKKSGKLMPLRSARQAMEALRQIYDAGYAVIDSHPENCLVDRNAGLMLIDFEFLYRYSQKPDSFEESYDIVGVPPDFSGDRPNRKPAGHGHTQYDWCWRPYTGLSLHSILRDSLWLQYVKRIGYVLVHSQQLFRRSIKRSPKAKWIRVSRRPLSFLRKCFPY